MTLVEQLRARGYPDCDEAADRLDALEEALREVEKLALLKTWADGPFRVAAYNIAHRAVGSPDTASAHQRVCLGCGGPLTTDGWNRCSGCGRQEDECGYRNQVHVGGCLGRSESGQ